LISSGNRDVFRRRERRQQVERLEDEADRLPRYFVFSPWLIAEKSLPKTVHSPPSRSRMPATTLISVVFPQPLGPTSMSSSPLRTSRSIPRRAVTAALPLP
jgi:hypothetical protein